MPPPEHGWSDEQVDQVIGNLLRVGVLLAAAVVLLGGVLYLFHHGSEPADYQLFPEEPRDLRGPLSVVAEARELHSRGLIQLGLLLLIATPVARVVFSVVAFAMQRDWIYVAVTLVVLGVLLYSLFSGGNNTGRMHAAGGPEHAACIPQPAGRFSANCSANDGVSSQGPD